MKRLVTLLIVISFVMPIQAQVPAPLKSGAFIGAFTADPSFHLEGWILYNQTEKRVKYSNGTSWVTLGFNTSLDYSLDGTWTFNEAVDFNNDIDLNSNTINGVGDAIDDDQVYNKGQVDALLGDINTSSIYGANGSIGNNIFRQLALGNSTILGIFAENGDAVMFGSDANGGESTYINTYEVVNIDNASLKIDARNSDVAEIHGKRGLEIKLGDSNGSVITPEVGDSFRVANASTGAIEYYTPPSNDLPYYQINQDDYTITQNQIENYTQLYIARGQTDVTLRIPSTTLTGQQFLSIQHLGTGTITILPETGVNLQQYVSSSNKSFLLSSIVQNEWFVRHGDVVASTYTPPVPLETPSFVQSYSGGGSAGDVTVSITNAVQDDVFIAYFSNNAGTPVTPTGWTELGKTNWSTYTDYVAYMKVSDGAETSVTFSNGGGTAVRGLVMINQYRGVDTSAPISDFQVIDALEGSVIPTPSLTSTGSNRLAIVTFVTPKFDSNDGSLTAPNTYNFESSAQSTSSGGTSVHTYSKDLLTATTQPGVQVTVPKSGFYAAFTLLLNPSN